MSESQMHIMIESCKAKLALVPLGDIHRAVCKNEHPCGALYIRGAGCSGCPLCFSDAEALLFGSGCAGQLYTMYRIEAPRDCLSRIRLALKEERDRRKNNEQSPS